MSAEQWGLTHDVIKGNQSSAVWRPHLASMWGNLSGLTIILKAEKVFLKGPLWQRLGTGN